MTRKEAIRVLEPFKACMFDQHGCPISDAAIALDVAIEALQAQKTGKWKLLHKGKDTSDYECTNCRGILMDVANDDSHELQRYCGMCGARMEREEE